MCDCSCEGRDTLRRVGVAFSFKNDGCVRTSFGEEEARGGGKCHGFTNESSSRSASMAASRLRLMYTHRRLSTAKEIAPINPAKIQP